MLRSTQYCDPKVQQGYDFSLNGVVITHFWAFGDSLLDNHEVWFSEEFLIYGMEGFEIQPVSKPLEDLGMYTDWLRGTIIKLPERQRIWVLTGDYDAERNGYLGRWPD